MRALLVLLLVASCHAEGPGAPLAASQELIVVAHQDDDLLFMQPDLIDAIHRGGLTTVYVTAGNGRQGAAVAERRYSGLRAAYGSVAGDDAWSCGWIDIAGHAAQHCRLERAGVSLVFLGYPDGGKQGERPASLSKLWQGQIREATTIAPRTTTYTRDGLIATVAEIVHLTHPAVVRTLDATAAHGYDHADHLAVGALAVAALGDTPVDLLAYRGYNGADEPPNAAGAAFDRTLPMVGHYEACAARCARCGDACTTIDPQHDAWMRRRYAIGFRRGIHGVLRAGSRCLAGTPTALALGDCATAPAWSLDELHARLDDEGHVWRAEPAGAGLACLVASDPPRFGACDAAQTWVVDAPLPAALAAIAPAQLVSADLDGDHRPDTCTLTPAGPSCQLAGEPLAIPWGFAVHGTVAFTPASGALVDIDGDGRADLCAIGDGEVRCARSQGHAFGPAFVVGKP